MRKCEKVILTERVTPRVGSIAHCLSKCNVRRNESMSIDDKYIKYTIPQNRSIDRTIQYGTQ